MCTNTLTHMGKKVAPEGSAMFAPCVDVADPEGAPAATTATEVTQTATCSDNADSKEKTTEPPTVTAPVQSPRLVKYRTDGIIQDMCPSPWGNKKYPPSWFTVANTKSCIS